jgi:hypothetical protein
MFWQNVVDGWIQKKKLSSIFNLSIRSICTNQTQKGNILAEKNG